MPETITLTPAERWRLLLGEAAETNLTGLNGEAAAMDRALSWLYGRDGGDPRDTLDRQGGNEPSALSVPDWINDIHTLFPKETIERLERDAIERYGIDEIVTNPEVLARATPNPALLEAVLRTKHLMNPEVLALARALVAQVVKDIMEKLAKQIERSFSGVKRRQRVVPTGAASQFAAGETLRRNLRHFDPGSRRLILARPWFHHNTRRRLERWQIILLVDQSGSMVSSVIHSAVTASCLWGLPGVKTHLIAFDTEIVDLTDHADDPVETLMKVQLGGGTHIGKALAYAAEQIEVPTRAIVVLVTDFYEGMAEYQLVALTAALVAQGTQVLGLAALNDRAEADFDRRLAEKLADVGAHIAAMTPGQLANWLAEKLG